MARVGVMSEGRVARSIARRRGVWFTGVVSVVLVGAALLTFLPHFITSAAPGHAATTVGVSDAQMHAAVSAAAWPQQVGNWCGIATIAAIADELGNPTSQRAVFNYLQSFQARSPWGTPGWNGIGPGVLANISNDSGTDPRSLAAAMRQFGGRWYSQMVDHNGAWDATGKLAADLEYSHQPISVIVFNGQHSVIVSKITANGDPAWNPGAITSLEVWDPGYGTPSGLLWGQSVTISLNTWLYDYRFWGGVYNDPLDPDPSVGPYRYDPSIGNYQHLWTGNYVYIRPGGIAGVSVDWAVDQDWVVIPGQRGELPPGYHLPPTPTPVATPTSLPTRVARLAPTALPTPLPPTPTPEPTATATPAPALQLNAQSLCVDTTCLDPSAVPWWYIAIAAFVLTVTALLVIFLALRRRGRRRHPPQDTPSVSAREAVAAASSDPTP